MRTTNINGHKVVGFNEAWRKWKYGNTLYIKPNKKRDVFHLWVLPHGRIAPSDWLITTTNWDREQWDKEDFISFVTKNINDIVINEV